MYDIVGGQSFTLLFAGLLAHLTGLVTLFDLLTPEGGVCLIVLSPVFLRICSSQSSLSLEMCKKIQLEFYMMVGPKW